MRQFALFINGVYEGVLKDILAVQELLPEQILFLQPYSKERIVRLAENPPTVEKPIRLFTSLTSDLSHIHYTAEIVGWEDKQEISKEKEMVLNRLIYMFERTELGVYKTNENGICTNLIHVRRMKRLPQPFSVDHLVKTSNNEPLSIERTTSGGWSYVKDKDDEWLAQWLHKNH